jgi:hypothetical protein
MSPRRVVLPFANVTIGRGHRVNQRRRHPRFPVNALKLTGQMTYSSEVSVLDIGLGGVSLRADQRLNIGGKYHLKLVVDEKVIPVTCEVAWARLSGTRRSMGGEIVPVYTAGMKFIGLAPDSASDLHDLVSAMSDAGGQEDERRAHARAPVPAPGIALMDFPADYTARVISLSGMLIESGTPVETESRIPMVLCLEDGERMDIRGRVVSCELASGNGESRYRIGIEFIELPDHARDALAAFLVSLPGGDAEAGA